MDYAERAGLDSENTEALVTIITTMDAAWREWQEEYAKRNAPPPPKVQPAKR